LQNISAFTFDMPAGHSTLWALEKVKVILEGQPLNVSRPKSDRSWRVHFRLVDGRWRQALSPELEDQGKLIKKHGLSGPIDDAFMDKFLFVKPTQAAWNEKMDAWSKAELERAQFEWRRQFRGDAPMKDDTAISEADIAANNLILWGDPISNEWIDRLRSSLPIQWTKDTLTANGKTYPSTGHLPVLIYPADRIGARYIVLNSGPVIGGIIVTKKFAYDIWGDTVILASRMESQGQPGLIQITTTTRALLDDKFETQAGGVIDIKNIGPMQVFHLINPAAA
jgi:hypothetical protein